MIVFFVNMAADIVVVSLFVPSSNHWIDGWEWRSCVLNCLWAFAVDYTF